MARLSILTVAACALGALAGCSFVALRSNVEKNATPVDRSGYVAGIFSSNYGEGYGLGLHNAETGEDIVMAFGERSALPTTREGQVTMIELPPGQYRVSYWVTYGTLTRERSAKKDLPEEHPLARPFALRAGQVVLLGWLSSDTSRSSSYNGWARETHTTWRIAPEPIGRSEAVAKLLANYPAFKQAAVDCLLCEPENPRSRQVDSGRLAAPHQPSTPRPADGARGELEQCTDAASCARAGRAYLNGEGVTKDVAAATRLYQKACDMGRAETCGQLAFLYQSGEAVPKDTSRAAALYLKACEGGVAKACSNLAIIYEDGGSFGKDFARAAQLYQKACDGANATGCLNLARLYFAGRGVAKDHTRAARLCEKACDTGAAQGCRYLAAMYHVGDGVPPDSARAAALYQKGCDGGDARACAERERIAE
jgi:hypothetical protein